VGELKTVSIHYDSNNKPKGAAEIVYRHRAGAEAAVKEFDGREVRSGRGAGGGWWWCRSVARWLKSSPAGRRVCAAACGGCAVLGSAALASRLFVAGFAARARC
jgi:hypothetical protein